MSGVNKVILVGRLGKDPEVRNLENGAVVANFSVATSESYKTKSREEKGSYRMAQVRPVGGLQIEQRPAQR